MARKPRINIFGSYYHVILRGNAGDDIFFSREDRDYFYQLIQDGIEKYHHHIHAFCCMTNHVHLLIQIKEISLSKIIQNLSFRYTRWINRKKQRKGHLFQGRYKAILIEKDSYLLQLVRYIHLNPVRANLTKRPEIYLWSSHRAYLGKENISWLTTKSVLSQFGKNTDTARLQYCTFVNQGVNEKYRNEFTLGTHEGRILGDELFTQDILKQSEQVLNPKIQMKDLVKMVCLTFNIDLKDLIALRKEHLFARSRGVLALFVTEIPSLMLTELSRILNRDISTLSRQAARIRKLSQSDKKLAKQIEIIRDLLFLKRK